MVQRIGVELGGLLDRGQAGVERLVDRLQPGAYRVLACVNAPVQRLVGFFRIDTGLADAPGKLLQVGSQRQHLAGGVVGGGGDLVGQPRQTLMQRPNRFLDALICGAAFQSFQPRI